MLDRAFSLRGRIGRLRFFLDGLALGAICLVLALVLAFVVPARGAVDGIPLIVLSLPAQADGRGDGAAQFRRRRGRAARGVAEHGGEERVAGVQGEAAGVSYCESSETFSECHRQRSQTRRNSTRQSNQSQR